MERFIVTVFAFLAGVVNIIRFCKLSEMKDYMSVGQAIDYTISIIILSITLIWWGVEILLINIKIKEE